MQLLDRIDRSGVEEIEVRDYDAGDIGVFVDYWHDRRTEHIRDMGVCQDRLPDREAMTAALALGLETAGRAGARSRLRVVAIRWRNRTVGFHQVTNLNRQEGSAIMHAYIIDACCRGKGLGTISYVKAMDLFFRRFDLNFIDFHTPDRSGPATRIKQKLGILPIGKTTIDLPFLIKPLAATRYRVHAHELPRLRRRMFALAGGVWPGARP
ncbi:MAG: hypothetical protein HKM95_15530 [Inquilinus sp.]|nr:hypothetical protein [Inquilinus sp.]